MNSAEVDYINAHGSSSYVADIKETRAVKNVFGDHSKELKISSIKSMIGHPLAAAGAVQVASTLLCAEKGYIFPTVNYEKKDPECDLDYVPNEAIRKQIKNAIVNSFGLGGNNTCMALRMG
jgi:3-oxoacyl-[acyl-carrier-protein] synthase II